MDERWKADLAGAEVCGLALAERGVVVATTADGQSIGFDLVTGVRLPPPPEGWVTIDVPEVSSGGSDGEGDVEVWEGGVGAFDAISGSERWWCELDDDYLVSLARDVGQIVVNGRRGLHVVDAVTGQFLGLVGAGPGDGINFGGCEPGPVICTDGWAVAFLADWSLVGVDVIERGVRNSEKP